MHYERVTFKDGNRERTVYLRITGESALFLRGIEVRKDGEEISGPTWDQRLRIIMHECIVARTRLRVNHTYDTLEEDK